VSTTEDLIERFFQGDRTACARVISLVENEADSCMEIMDALYPKVGNARRIGITGPPGAGKSTTVEKLTGMLRRQKKSVGIIAVDPTSPFSGGAILGDRVRMSSLFLDPEVFIRSMATRGSLGGLSRRTKVVSDVLDAFGTDIILIETVGVGQAELDIMNTTHTTMVVLVPESGDGIQAMKAGLMEIGEIFCVNKADREGADRLVTEIEMILEMRRDETVWKPPVIKTQAREGQGFDQLLAALASHADFLRENNLLEVFREKNIRAEITDQLENSFLSMLWDNPDVKNIYEKKVEEVIKRASSPGRAAQEILLLLRKRSLI